MRRLVLEGNGTNLKSGKPIRFKLYDKFVMNEDVRTTLNFFRNVAVSSVSEKPIPASESFDGLYIEMKFFVFASQHENMGGARSLSDSGLELFLYYSKLSVLANEGFIGPEHEKYYPPIGWIR